MISFVLEDLSGVSFDNVLGVLTLVFSVIALVHGRFVRYFL